MTPFASVRTLAFRSRPAASFRPVIGIKRTYADDNASTKHNNLPQAQEGQVGPNMQQGEHVSEEAAKMNQIMGGEGPDIEGQGTPVQDVCHTTSTSNDWRS